MKAQALHGSSMSSYMNKMLELNPNNAIIKELKKVAEDMPTSLFATSLTSSSPSSPPDSCLRSQRASPSEFTAQFLSAWA